MAQTLLGHVVVMRARAIRGVLVAAGTLLAAAASGACGAVASTPEDGVPGRDVEERAPNAAPMWGKLSSKAASCGAPTPLLVHHDTAGHVDRLHARLRADGREGPFLVDTGSQMSFATRTDGDDSAAKSTSAVVYCASMDLPILARLRPGTTPDGAPQIGVLGADLLAHGEVLDLDFKKGHLAWYQPAPAPPPGAVVLPVELRKGWLVASGIRIGGRDVKLVVDTGATNVIVVDSTPRVGEVREDAVDGTASPIVLFHGQGEIAYTDGVTRRIPVDRTDSFPTLQGLIETLGRDVVGLLGVTALGHDRVVIGRDSLIMMLSPVIPDPR